MKIWFFSDLHADVQPDSMPYGYAPADADVCVVAGDVLSGPESIEYLAQRIGIPTIFVPGNHEYWGQVYQETRDDMLRAAKGCPHLHVLSDGQSVVIDNVLFTGGTLFTDFLLFGRENKDDLFDIAKEHGHDFKRIGFKRFGGESRLFQPADAVAIHQRTLERMRESLSGAPHLRKVVVSHFAPGHESVAPEYKGVVSSAWYSSDLSNFIRETRPDVWIHGHVHSSFDYEVEGCRVLCNPRGFGRENMRFEWDRIVCIPEPRPVNSLEILPDRL